MITSLQAEHRASFYAALRSGEFTKGRYRLRRRDGSCCVMGVATMVALRDGAPITLVDGVCFREADHPRLYSALPPHCIAEWYGFPERNPVLGSQNQTATFMSDDHDLNFGKLADLFERYYPATSAAD